MPDTTTISARIPSDIVAKLDHVAKAADRDRSWVIIRALRHYLEHEYADVDASIENDYSKMVDAAVEEAKQAPPGVYASAGDPKSQRGCIYVLTTGQILHYRLINGTVITNTLELSEVAELFPESVEFIAEYHRRIAQ